MAKRPLSLYALALLLVAQALGGIGGGITLVLSPSGEMMQMPLSMLDGSPFNSFLIPGLILLLVLGLLPTFVVYGLLLRPDWRWAEVLNIYRGIHWSWTYSLYLGIMLCGWIFIEISIIDYDALQTIFGLVGIAILILTLLPANMRWFGWLKR
jgi:hypothetical protein